MRSSREHSLLFRWTDPSLLNGKPPARVMLVQDLTGLVTAKRDRRDSIFGQLRQIYDGRLSKATGMGEDLLWEGYLGLLGAVTPRYDEVAELNSILGERFILYRPERRDVRAEAQKATERTAIDDDWREIVAAYAKRAVELASRHLQAVELPDSTTRSRLIDLAQLTALCRTSVPRDGYSKVLRIVPQPEGPSRLANQFTKLLRGLSACRGVTTPDENDLRIVAKVARDSIPAIRLAVLQTLADGDCDRPRLIECSRLPRATLHYVLEDLMAIGVVNTAGQQCLLTRDFRALADRAGFFGHRRQFASATVAARAGRHETLPRHEWEI